MKRRGEKVEVKCACGCGVKFMARVADRKRGWGKFASKSCKAKKQEQQTGQYSRLLASGVFDDNDDGHPICEDW